MSAVDQQDLPGLIGHELRNPLASALTGAMLARDLVDADDPRAAVLDGVLRDLDRMTGLLDGWLQLAREDRAPTARVDVEALLTEVTTSQRAELVSAPPAVAVACDRALLTRAIENLCENARNAGAATVRVAAQHDGERVAVHVEDDGRGVAPEDVERVFEAGWSGSGGTGLGLHAVRATVQAVGGEVRCVPVASGARFTITLPRAERASR
ncbi:MAG: sensor histidine kinase [Planctomycetota bacterium]